MISLLITLFLLVVAFWAIRTIIPALGLPEPISTVLYVILVVVMVLYLLRVFGLLTAF